MEPNEQIIDQVDRYLSNQMDRLEREDFSRLVETDEEVMEELRLQQGTEVLTRAYRRMELHAILDDIARKHNKPNHGHSSQLWMPFLLIAATLLLLFGFFFFSQINKNVEFLNEEQLASALYSTNYETYALQKTFRTEAHTENQIIPDLVSKGYSLSMAKGMDAYIQENFLSAISLFKQVDKQDPDRSWADFLSGISHLELDNFDAAIVSLEAVSNPSLEGEVYWYTGMAYVKKVDFEKANSLFGKAIQTELLETKKETATKTIIAELQRALKHK